MKFYVTMRTFFDLFFNEKILTLWNNFYIFRSFKVPLRRKFVGLFRPNSVAEYSVVSIFTQKTEQETVHPNSFRLQSCVKCVRHYWKRVSLWRQRLTSVAFPSCVLTQGAYRRLRNLRRVILRFGTVLSFRSIGGFISFGKWRIFLTVRCKNWCQEIIA